MSEQTSQPEIYTDSEGAELDAAVLRGEERRARKTGTSNTSWRIGFTQIALAALTAIVLWQWLEGHRAINDLHGQMAKKIAQVDGISKDDKSLLTQSQSQVRELSSRMASLEAQFAETQNQRAALETLYADMSAGRDETVLAEVEQMLLIAAEQLQLSANVKVAMIALQNADARLQRTNRPAFNALRKIISQDIAKLRALPQVDISGANSLLDKLMASVDELPLAYRQRVNAQAQEKVSPIGETTWQRVWRELGQEARQLVRIENTGKVDIPLVPPSQEFFLRENLKLRLMSARLALMSHNEGIFRREVQTAQVWTTRYFDDKSSEGSRMLSGLKTLAAADIRIDAPDISHSLQAVSNFRLMREGEPRVSFEHLPKGTK